MYQSSDDAIGNKKRKIKMDIYEYLKKDHQKVAKLFDLFKTSPSDRNRLDIIEMISKELFVHAEAEQHTFYKALELNKQAEDEIEHSEKEHHQIKSKILEILSLKKFNNLLDVKLIELQKIVEHHVNEEEGKIFRMAKKILSDEEAIFLKEKMHDCKGKLLLHYDEKEINKIIKQTKEIEKEEEVGV